MLRNEASGGAAARTPLVIGNWKIAPGLEVAVALARALTPVSGVEMAVCPPFPWLVDVSRALPEGVALGAQNMHFEERGGFTGEVSPLMMRGLCRYVLVGHSERRVHFRETPWAISQKVQAALRNGLSPVLCVGETADQQEAGEAGIVLSHQLETELKGVALGPELVIAYDPVWGTTGLAHPPHAGDIGGIAGFIRQVLEDMQPGAGEQVRVIYAGPLPAGTAPLFADLPELDGLLIGVQSLRAEEFMAIAGALASARKA